MMPYTLRDHTADVRLQVTGKTLKELFADALQGMTSVLTGRASKSRLRNEIPFTITAPDTESLLVDFLNEALYVMQTQKARAASVKFIRLDRTDASGIVNVVPVDCFQVDIKAATYHDIHIRQMSDGHLETVIVFDI
jgi:SHS2 domain-containing protein